MGRALSRRFGTDANENEIKWVDIATNAKEFEISEESIRKLEKWVKHIIPLAKDGERERIETTLKEKCGFIESDAALMAQWFLDNFKLPAATEQGLLYFVSVFVYQGCWMRIVLCCCCFVRIFWKFLVFVFCCSI